MKAAKSTASIAPEVPTLRLMAVCSVEAEGRVYCGRFPSREFAERVLAKFQADGTAEEFGLPVSRSDAGTLGEHAVGFLRRRALAHSAHETDVGRWKNHLEPTFGKLRPGDIDQGLIRRIIEAKLAEGLASATVRSLVALLSSLYIDLIEDKLATVNPARGAP